MARRIRWVILLTMKKESHPVLKQKEILTRTVRLLLVMSGRLQSRQWQRQSLQKPQRTMTMEARWLKGRKIRSSTNHVSAVAVRVSPCKCFYTITESWKER